MKNKVREICIYRKEDNGEIRPRIYCRCDRDWKYEDKADFLAAIMDICFGVTVYIAANANHILVSVIFESSLFNVSNSFWLFKRKGIKQMLERIIFKIKNSGTTKTQRGFYLST